MEYLSFIIIRDQQKNFSFNPDFPLALVARLIKKLMIFLAQIQPIEHPQ